jgi:farnesyl diphosphate synthase
MTPTDFQTLLASHGAQVETFLAARLSVAPLPGEIERPGALMDAVRHGVLNGGKRFRPFLVFESAALFDAPAQGALHVAAALECIHCYSLIHDDLPAMDDDDMRRGRPTVHKAYDEATAILAGDSLLTFAFDLVTDRGNGLTGDMRSEIAGRMARAAGFGGMVGGQALDLSAGRDRPGIDGILRLQAMKTGALIRYACEAGAVAGGANDNDIARLSSFGETIGLAFQLADDLLDVTQSPEAMGKATGKDAAAGKATLVGSRGEDSARAKIDALVADAEKLLSPFGEGAQILAGAAQFVARRTF